MRKGDWILTYTGIKFYPMDPRIEDICIEDIAHALSNNCRYTGHCSTFYSVASHSLLVSLVCDPKDALHGLLHDASEAYIADVSRPLKKQPIMDGYRETEDIIQRAVYKRFGLSPIMPASVKVADERALFTEKRDLFKPLNDDTWGMGIENTEPYAEAIIPMPPHIAKDFFLMRFEELYGRP